MNIGRVDTLWYQRTLSRKEYYYKLSIDRDVVESDRGYSSSHGALKAGNRLRDKLIIALGE